MDRSELFSPINRLSDCQTFQSTVGPHHFIIDIDECCIVLSLQPAICRWGSIQSLSGEGRGRVIICLLLNSDLMPNLLTVFNRESHSGSGASEVSFWKRHFGTASEFLAPFRTRKGQRYFSNDWNRFRKVLAPF